MASNLFQKYGGFAVISKVVMAFYERAVDSDIIGGYFEGVDMRRLIDHQTKFISSIMGGPASYTDKALRQAHAHLSIDRRAFDEMTRLLEETLIDADFDSADVQQIMQYVRDRADAIVSPGGG